MIWFSYKVSKKSGNVDTITGLVDQVLHYFKTHAGITHKFTQLAHATTRSIHIRNAQNAIYLASAYL